MTFSSCAVHTSYSVYIFTRICQCCFKMSDTRNANSRAVLVYVLHCGGCGHWLSLWRNGPTCVLEQVILSCFNLFLNWGVNFIVFFLLQLARFLEVCFVLVFLGEGGGSLHTSCCWTPHYRSSLGGFWTLCGWGGAAEALCCKYKYLETHWLTTLPNMMSNQPLFI